MQIPPIPHSFVCGMAVRERMRRDMEKDDEDEEGNF
jgi:hypothetical protein